MTDPLPTPMPSPLPPPVPRVSRKAMVLGFAGLLPQIGAVALILYGEKRFSLVLAVIYPLLILSFLGGIWWGFAMRRTDRQAPLATIAVIPSLVALALIGWVPLVESVGWPLVAIGVALLTTLLVDRHLVRTGEAPLGWMRLRVPLSVGLGGLTIVAGYLLR